MRYLLVRLDGLGDTMLTTPMLRAIREHDAESFITIIASPFGSACLRNHAGVDELIVMSVAETSLGQKLALGERLRRMRFDAAITVTEKAWGYLWVRQSCAPRRIGFWAGATQPIKAGLFFPTLTDRVSSPNDPSAPSSLHEVERIMRLLEPLGVRAEAGPLWLAGQPASASSAALHLSHKWLADGWSAQWLADLVAALRSQMGEVLVTAGPAEQSFARDLAGRMDGVRALLDGRFEEWTAALRACRVLITMDTGAVHVAAALGVPVVDVFARQGAAHCVPRWKPWQVPHRVVLRGHGDDETEAARVRQDILRASADLVGETCHVA